MTGSSASLLSRVRQGDPALFRVVQPSGENRIVAMPLSESEVSLRRLENEYSFRELLDASWATVPEAFVRYDERLVLVSTDPGGSPLREHCGAQWALEVFLGVASGLTRAVQAMHERRIVHLNLTPDDVLFDDATGHLALCGFGYAAFMGAPLHAAPNPSALAYTAPEVLGGLTQTADVSADLYSLGCLFYELLAGRPPFDESDALAWLHAHLASLPLPLDRIRSELPHIVVGIVMKLLEKQPVGRYPSASALLADIEVCRRMFGCGSAQGADVVAAMHRFGGDAPVQTAYGRDVPLAILKASLTGAEAGEAGHLVLVSGEAGVGKTVLVQAFRESLVSDHVVFAECKSDRATQQVPFAVLTEILQSLLRPMLGAADEEFKGWRDALQTGLGSAAGSLSKLIPGSIGDSRTNTHPGAQRQEGARGLASGGGRPYLRIPAGRPCNRAVLRRLAVDRRGDARGRASADEYAG
jgi:hypothetical protein